MKFYYLYGLEGKTSDGHVEKPHGYVNPSHVVRVEQVHQQAKDFPSRDVFSDWVRVWITGRTTPIYVRGFLSDVLIEIERNLNL